MPNGPYFRIWDIEGRSMNGERLPDEEVQLAQAALDSRVFLEKMSACGVLLRCPCAQETKQQALKVLEETCRHALDNKTNFHPSFAFVLQFVPTRALLETQAIRSFVYEAAAAGDRGCRTNIMLTLERLCRHGDAKAGRLLKLACDDPEENVRYNAVRSLKRLETSGT